MKTACKLLIGVMLILAVPGCRCFGDPGYDTCWTAPNAPVAGTLTPPQVTMQ
jgi:hypothetical protein